jgi:hypothetical protein
MKKAIILLILTLSCYPFLGAQVFISSLYANQMLLGPDNVKGHLYPVAQVYVNAVTDAIGIINADKEWLTETMENMQKQDKLSKKEKRLLLQYLARVDSLIQEKKCLDTLKSRWEAYLHIGNSLPLLYEAVQAGQCVQIRTDHGMFATAAVEITTENPRDIALTEVIPFENKPADTKWVKKIATENCRSANPDDCLVWCLVNTPAQQGIRDMNGVLHPQFPSSIPQEGNNYIRKKRVPHPADALPVYIVKNRNDGSILRVLGWQKC